MGGWQVGTLKCSSSLCIERFLQTCAVRHSTIAVRQASLHDFLNTLASASNHVRLCLKRLRAIGVAPRSDVRPRAGSHVWFCLERLRAMERLRSFVAEVHKFRHRAAN